MAWGDEIRQKRCRSTPRPPSLAGPARRPEVGRGVERDQKRRSS